MAGGKLCIFKTRVQFGFFLIECAKYKSKNIIHYDMSKTQINNFFQILDQKTYRLQFDAKIQI